MSDATKFWMDREGQVYHDVCVTDELRTQCSEFLGDLDEAFCDICGGPLDDADVDDEDEDEDDGDDEEDPD